MVTLENWQERVGEDMWLRDYSERTRGAYALAKVVSALGAVRAGVAG